MTLTTWWMRESGQSAETVKQIEARQVARAEDDERVRRETERLSQPAPALRFAVAAL
jgi:hypothetical protein